MVAWCTRRSTAASVIAGSGKTRFHSPNGWLAVIISERRSYGGRRTQYAVAGRTAGGAFACPDYRMARRAPIAPSNNLKRPPPNLGNPTLYLPANRFVHGRPATRSEEHTSEIQ